jgi:hypothetical protein
MDLPFVEIPLSISCQHHPFVSSILALAKSRAPSANKSLDRLFISCLQASRVASLSGCALPRP